MDGPERHHGVSYVLTLRGNLIKQGVVMSVLFYSELQHYFYFTESQLSALQPPHHQVLNRRVMSMHIMSLCHSNTMSVSSVYERYQLRC